MHSVIKLLLLSLLIVHFALAKGEVPVYASGELHGSLKGADGIAQKVATIRLDHEILLIDGGGFLAGGIYDLFTGGRTADSLQSVALWEKCYSLSYDAIGVGDEELQYGEDFINQQQDLFPLPLVSANVTLSQGNGKSIVPYIIIKKGRKKIAITSVVTQQQILSYGKGIKVSSVKQALDTLIPELSKSVDEILLLAHVGEDVSKKIAKEYPSVKIILNGHKKKSSLPVEMVGSTAVMQFGFLGTSISQVEISDSLIQPDSLWHKISIDTSVSARTATSDRADLYMMSGCPFAHQALRELLDLMSDMPLELHIWFIGTLTSKGPVPALKSGSVLIEKQWMSVQRLYPNMQQDFLWLIVDQELSFDKAIATLKLDKAKIDTWIKEKGTQEIALHYRRSRTLQMSSSPNLWMNNRHYKGELFANRLLLGACLDGNLEGKVCDTLGSCVSDQDCADTDSTVGVCQKGSRGGACLNRKEPLMTMYTILPSSSLWSIDTAFYNENKKLFPSISFEDISPLHGDSARYTEFLAKTTKRRLPLIVVDSTALSAYRYHEVAEMFEPCGEYLCLSYDKRPDGVYVDRPLHEGEIAVFADTTVWSETLLAEIKSEFPLYPMGDVPEGATMGLWLNNQELFTVKSFIELQELVKEIKDFLDTP